MAGNLGAFLKDEFAATAIEYGLIAAGIAVAIIYGDEGPRWQTQHHIYFGFVGPQVSRLTWRPRLFQ